MGIDLRLLPMDHESEIICFSHTILSCGRDYKLFDVITKAQKEHGKDVHDDFTSFLATGSDGESTYGKIKTNPYGEKVQTLTAFQLCTAFGETESEGKNKAIEMYLRNLPTGNNVVLYWH